MPATAVTPRPSKFVEGGDPYSAVPEAQDYLKQSVEGYGAQLQPSILKDVGDALGGLNATGGLRSGGAEVALGDIATKYGAMVGAYAKQATSEGLTAGLAARRQQFAEDQAKRARKAALLKAVGSVLGAGIGFIASGGNPAGLVAGAKAGGSIGGPGASDATYDPGYA